MKWTSFIMFNMVVSLTEVCDSKHFSLQKLVKYITRDSIVEWFPGYGLLRLEGSKQMYTWASPYWSSYFYELWQNCWFIQWQGQQVWWCLLAFLPIAAWMLLVSALAQAYIESFWVIYLGLFQCGMVHHGTYQSL